MNLDFWSVVIIVIIFQGLFLLSVLLFSPKKRFKRGNIYLFSLIALFIWFLAEFLAIRNTFMININVFYGTRYGSWLLVGPLTYFYFKSIKDQQWKFSKFDALHFLPFLAFVLLIPILSGDSLSTRQIHYGMLSVFDYRKKTVTPFEYLYSVIFFVQFIHLGIYLIYNAITVKRYSHQLKMEYSKVNSTRWLSIFNVLLIITLVFASLFLYILFTQDFYRRELDYIYVVPMGLFVYSIAYRLSGIQWLPLDNTVIPKYHTSSLKTLEKEDYAARLHQLMGAEKPYLKNDLRIKELAEMLDIGGHHLSQVINENFQCTFFDFINKHRVQEAKELITAHPRHTLLQIAFDAGFNNKTSFVNAFKKFEGKTPSAFKRDQDLS